MWLYESVFYQIYPLGFCGSSTVNDGSSTHNIRNVLDWIPHFKSLGIHCILFNPIFESDSHGYDTRDFTQIDKRLGTNEDFQIICNALKTEGIRIVLDGVFNHVGRGFWAFQDVLKHQQNSPYVNWFLINFDGNSNYNDGFWYEGWEGHYELVKLNLHNPAVINYLLTCIQTWIQDFHIDGLRLDVAYSLDHEFLRQLRYFTQSLSPEFALIGEVLFGDYNLIVNDSMLHSCTNYECYKGLFSSMNDQNLYEIAHSLHRQFGNDNWCIYRNKHLMTFVDNHDVSRVASILNNKLTLPIVYGILFGMPGIPCIYYGSEWGEPGSKQSGGDWNLRPCFPAPISNELTTQLQQWILMRQQSQALCYGSYTTVCITNQQLIFKREFAEECIYILINIVDNSHCFYHGELLGTFFDLMDHTVRNLGGSVELPPYSVQFLRKF